MTKAILFYRNSLLTKVFMLVMLLVGGGSSAWGDGKTLPYNYGFETALATEGWAMQNCYTSSGNTGLQAYGTHAGSNCFRFYGNSSYVPQYIISPELSTSSFGLNVCFFHKGYGSDYPISFYVGYSTTDTSIENFTWGDEMTYCLSTWIICEKSFPAGTKYVAIKYNSSLNEKSQVCRLFLDDFSFSENNPYKTPTDFNLSSFTSTSATFSWTAGNAETAWQISYSEDENFTEGSEEEGVTTIDITTSDLVNGEYILSDLTTGKTYYAAICANYGDDHYSNWSDKISFTPRNEIETTVNNGTTMTSGYAPIYGNYTTSLTRTQIIIPSDSLASMQNRKITKLTFYSTYETRSWGDATFDVYVKEIDNSAYSTTTLESWGTNVRSNTSAKLTVSDYKMQVEFDVPFNYTTGNLMIGFKQIATGSYQAPYWKCLSNGSSKYILYGYGTNSNNISATRPKVTLTSIPVTTAPVKIGATGFTTFSSPWALDLSSLPSGLKAYYITESGATEEAGKVKLTQLTEAVAANTGLLIKGTAGNVYEIPTTTSGTDLSSTNLLTAVGPLESLLSISSDKYVLVNNGGKAEFQNLAENSATIPGGKSYLDLTGITLPSSARLSISFDDGDTPTGIRIQENNVSAPDNTLYNLYGQKVEKTGRGIYIINGKKVILK